ncbi:MAG: tRNA threonylcarbamoyladenosine dehydratase [Clostridia bacterium]
MPLNKRFNRSELLIGNKMNNLYRSKVIIFGIGGVGGYCAEGLARSGINEITLVDNDIISESNINRQIIALNSTIGKYKTEVMRNRIQDINPDCQVTILNSFLTADNIEDFKLERFNYIADCIDTITSKIALAVYCDRNNLPLISAMGAGNKLNAENFKTCDIYETSGCPLAKVMRHELKKRNVHSLKVVYSPDLPLSPHSNLIINAQNNEKVDQLSCSTSEDVYYENTQNVQLVNESQLPPPLDRHQILGSVSFVPSVCGMLMCGSIVRDLIKDK